MAQKRHAPTSAVRAPSLKTGRFFAFHFLFSATVLAVWSAYCLKDTRQVRQAMLDERLQLLVDHIAGERPERLEASVNQLPDVAQVQAMIVDADRKIFFRTKGVPFAPSESVAHLSLWQSSTLSASMALLPGQPAVRSSHRALEGTPGRTLVLYADLAQIGFGDIPFWPERLIALSAVLLFFGLGHWLGFYAFVETRSQDEKQFDAESDIEGPDHRQAA